MKYRNIKQRALQTVVAVASLLGTTLRAQDGTPSAFDGPKEKLHIYLLIGQSNMAGRAPFPEEDAGVIERCYLLNGQDQWEPARNPLNRYSTIRKGMAMQKLNPGYTFAKRMLEKDKAISVGLVVNAKGGTGIDQWKKGTSFYEDAVRRTREAQKTGTLKGILWHQGETNVKTFEGYLDKLKALVVDLREDLGNADLPFIAGQINDAPVINDQIAELPQTLPATGFVRAEGLQAMDRWHFDTESMKRLGERYADEMRNVQKQSK